jgi:ComF family protein
MVPAESPRCSRCWQVGPPDCGRCGHLEALDGVRAAWSFDGPARDAVLALKYQYLTSLAPQMSAQTQVALSDHLPPDLLLSVPLHTRRQRARGFNQAELLAAPLRRELGVSQSVGFLRTVHTRPQVRTASARERLRNVEGAFAWKGNALDGKRVLLIDDVTTTGATLEACARTLKIAGAAEVHGLTYARED